MECVSAARADVLFHNRKDSEESPSLPVATNNTISLCALLNETNSHEVLVEDNTVASKSPDNLLSVERQGIDDVDVASPPPAQSFSDAVEFVNARTSKLKSYNNSIIQWLYHHMNFSPVKKAIIGFNFNTKTEDQCLICNDKGALIASQESFWRVAALDGHAADTIPLLFQTRAFGSMLTAEVVRVLIAAKVDATVLNKNGMSCINIAAFNGHLDIVKMLIAAEKHVAVVPGAPVKIVIPAPTQAQLTAQFINQPDKLDAAVQNMHFEVVQWLLQYGANINAITLSGITPLYVAAFNGYLQVIEWLIARNVDINQPNNDGLTPLLVASHNGKTDCRLRLVAAGADIERYGRKNQVTPLYSAVQNNHVEIAKYLIRRGANVSVHILNGNTPLHSTCIENRPILVDMLLKAGAEVNAQTRDLGTPLYLACEKGNVEIVKTLLAITETDVNIFNMFNVTAINIAAQNGSLGIVRLLLKRGANVIIQTNLGPTPLFISAQNGFHEIVDADLKDGAIVHAPTAEGETAMFAAAYFGHLEHSYFDNSHRDELQTHDQENLTLPRNRLQQTPLINSYDTPVNRHELVVQQKYHQVKNRPKLNEEGGESGREMLYREGEGENYESGVSQQFMQPATMSQISSSVPAAFICPKIPADGLKRTHFTFTLSELMPFNRVVEELSFCLSAYKNHKFLYVEVDIKWIGDIRTDSGSCKMELKIFVVNPSIPQYAIECTRLSGDIAPFYSFFRELDLNLNNFDLHDMCKAEELSDELIAACAGGNEADVKMWLKNKSIDINRSEENSGMAAIHVACKHGHSELVKILLASGANAHQLNRSGHSGLDLARLELLAEICGLKLKDMKGAAVEVRAELLSANETQDESEVDITTSVSLLLVEYQAVEFNESQFVEKLRKATALEQEVNTRDIHLNSLLHYACRFGHFDVVKILLESGTDLHQRSGDLFLPLHIACHCNGLAIVQLLLAKGAVVDARDSHLRTALSVACEFGMKNTAVILLEHGAKPNMFDEYLKTPLHYAAEFARDDLIDLLTVDYEASRRNFVKIRSPLHWAALSGHVNTCRKLIAKGDDVNSLDANDDSPLILACIARKLKVVQLLAQHNASVDVVNLSGKTALHYLDDEDCLEKLSVGLKQRMFQAVYNGELPQITMLLDLGLSVECKDQDGNTPLFHACRLMSVKVVEHLMASGANSSAQNHHGETPIMATCRRGSESILSLLLTSKPDLSIKDGNEMTAWHYASSGGHDDMLLRVIEGTFTQAQADLFYGHYLANLNSLEVNSNPSGGYATTPELAVLESIQLDLQTYHEGTFHLYQPATAVVYNLQPIFANLIVGLPRMLIAIIPPIYHVIQPPNLVPRQDNVEVVVVQATPADVVLFAAPHLLEGYI